MTPKSYRGSKHAPLPAALSVFLFALFLIRPVSVSGEIYRILVDRDGRLIGTETPDGRVIPVAPTARESLGASLSDDNGNTIGYLSDEGDLFTYSAVRDEGADASVAAAAEAPSHPARGVAIPIQPSIPVIKIIADQVRPYLYVLQSLVGEAYVTVIDTEAETVVATLPTGGRATDLSVSYGDERLYVSNWLTATSHYFSVSDFNTSGTVTLTADAYHLNAGIPNRVYIEGEDQWVDLEGFDTGTGMSLGHKLVREGDGEIDPSGSFYYHCDNDSSRAQLEKYSLSGGAPVLVGESIERGYGTRNLVMSADGTRLFWQKRMYDANVNELSFLPEEIWATTRRGELAFSAGAVYSTQSGAKIYTLPMSTPHIAIAKDQDKVLYYDSPADGIRVIPMADIAQIEGGAGLDPQPADGEVVVLPLPRFSWSTVPAAISYRVYLGTDRTMVEEAETDSPLYLGEVVATSLETTTVFALGQTYYWRIDTVGFMQTIVGDVTQFQVAPLVVSPNRLETAYVLKAGDASDSLAVADAGSGLAWTATPNAPWIHLSAESGTAPADIDITLETDTLPTGLSTSSISFHSDGIDFDIPVDFTLFAMQLSTLVADPERPYLYGLHPGSGTVDDAFLIVVDANAEAIDRVLPVGANATDLSVSTADDRLYVSNWQRANTHVFDLTTLEEVEPLSLGADVYRINAAATGRVITEEEDQWVALRLINTATEGTLHNTSVREGDGEVDPTNRFYYHCDNNISNAHITKYDITGDTFANIAVTPTIGSSRHLVLSPDGSRLSCRSLLFDANLNLLRNLGAEIYAFTPDASLAFSTQSVIDTATGAVVAPLPFTTSALVTSNDGAKLFLYHPAEHDIHCFALEAVLSGAYYTGLALR